jgi:integrase
MTRTTPSKKPQQKLTTKICDNIREPGEYLDFNGPVPGLLFVIGDGQSKSWLLRYRRHGRRHEMGLGPYPETTLAAAREKGAEARRLLRNDIDPIEQRKQQRHELLLADAKDKNFLAVAEDLIAKKTAGDNPWWCVRYAQDRRKLLYTPLKPVHDMPLNSADTADALTLRLHEIIEPKWLTHPARALHIKQFANAICEHAYTLKVLPKNVANPAGPPLDDLLMVRQPEPGHRYAIPYQKVPALWTKLFELSKPAGSFYTQADAERAVGESWATIRQAIYRGDLRATKAESSHLAIQVGGMNWCEWRIEPEDLFGVFRKVIDVIPGLRAVIWELVKFCVLTGPRPSEAREMTWNEYDPIERLWIIPWERIKTGRETRQDMVIPLSNPANDIVLRMKEIQQRYKIETNYVFANYPSRFNTNAIIGRPPNHVTMLDNIRKAVPQDEKKTTAHGFRVTLRSWGEDQRRPDGMRMFDEKDLERAIGHIAGFGATKVSRIYSRQSLPLGLVRIFDGWAKFVTSGPAVILPFAQPAKQVTGG